jgi:flagellar L-ring protein precursor FlgH
MLATLVLSMQLTDLAADSLWKSDATTPICSDKKAHAIGDIITILIQESNTATRQNSTSTAHKSSISAAISSFIYGPSASGLLTKGGTLPAMSMANTTTHDGSGQINNQATITDRISVKVIDVLPNGNLIVEGRRQTSFSGEKEDAVLRGTVRSDDVSSANTVSSYNVADATIQFISKGTVTDSQNKGWFMRVWEKFSPF